jgi:hypothetical protein
MGMYANSNLYQWFTDEYSQRSKLKIDVGKSCTRFKNVNEIPYELIGELVRKITVEEWINLYELQFRKNIKSEK